MVSKLRLKNSFAAFADINVPLRVAVGIKIYVVVCRSAEVVDSLAELHFYPLILLSVYFKPHRSRNILPEIVQKAFFTFGFIFGYCVEKPFVFRYVVVIKPIIAKRCRLYFGRRNLALTGYAFSGAKPFFAFWRLCGNAPAPAVKRLRVQIRRLFVGVVKAAASKVVKPNGRVLAVNVFVRLDYAFAVTVP